MSFQSVVFSMLPSFQPIISLSISFIAPTKALSQMSASVVEVWQPEDADPLIPLQVITLFLSCLCLYEWGIESIYMQKTQIPPLLNAVRCMSTCVVSASPLCLAPLVSSWGVHLHLFTRRCQWPYTALWLYYIVDSVVFLLVCIVK